MKLLPLERLGAHERSTGVVDFGLLLPWISSPAGNRLWVKLIHERDQFLKDVPPVMLEMGYAPDPAYGDYWSAQLDLPGYPKPHPRSAWGEPGRYLYRYYLEGPGASQPIDWIIDPFAREFGVGKLSAFTLGYQAHTWSSHELDWKTPGLRDLIIYELMINEFGGDIEGTIGRLDYLADLGVNCIELMPVSNVANVVDWGFLPIGYFGVDERFGKRRDFQRLVDAAHQRGIAVIVDAVYGHTSENFPYCYVYRRLGYRDNPFMGPFGADYFGESVDFGRVFTQDFYFSVNHHWLDCYHVDGFRYDCVPCWWDGAVGKGYANLTYHTYQMTRAREGATDHWQRFFAGAETRLIQCAEQLEAPVEVLADTYSNCTWQNATLGAAQAVARGEPGAITALGLRLGLIGYPREATQNDDVLQKSALQYIENHDHSRFVCNFRTLFRGNELLGEGDRGMWYKLQPFLIALLTAPGIPLLWQGQEVGENYYLPEQGLGRALLFRPVRWDYFYDPVGRSLLALVRKLLALRRRRPELRDGDHFYYNDPDRYQSNGVMLFSRSDESRFTLVALNFGDATQGVRFAFPRGGDYEEQLHGVHDLPGVVAGVETWLEVPSHYGRIWAWAA